MEIPEGITPLKPLLRSSILLTAVSAEMVFGMVPLMPGNPEMMMAVIFERQARRPIASGSVPTTGPGGYPGAMQS